MSATASSPGSQPGPILGLLRASDLDREPCRPQAGSGATVSRNRHHGPSHVNACAPRFDSVRRMRGPRVLCPSTRPHRGWSGCSEEAAAQPGTLSSKQSTRRAGPCRPTMPTSLARAAEPPRAERERRAGFVDGVWRSADDDSSSHHATIEVIRGSSRFPATTVRRRCRPRAKLE